MSAMLKPTLAVLALLAVPGALVAQETETEKQAAREVLAKMAALEQSLDVPAMVARLTGPNPARDQVVARVKELMDKELLALADDIATHPEIGFQEKRSVQKLTEYLQRHDFSVEMGTGGLDTAFVARYRRNNGAPRLGIILEYDALRGTKGAVPRRSAQRPGAGGHGGGDCDGRVPDAHQHAGQRHRLRGARRGDDAPNAKTVMHEAHAFDGADVIVRSHGVSATTRPAAGFGTCCLNIVGAKYTFSGAPTHQMTPWNGRNALEAVIHFFENINAVRASIRPEARIQGIILEGGTAPNVVPDRTVADFYIRYPDEVYLQQVVEFVDNAAKAAALATGTKVKIDHYGKDLDGIGVATLGELGFAYMKMFGATNVIPEPGKPQGYEETGSVSRDIPGIGITAQSSTASNHTYEMDADNLKEVGHKGFTIDAEAMAAVLFDFATHADYREAVKREFAGIKALFGEYQAALKKVYTVPTVPDPK
jgi:metal-dependent amidase/aminoacylase/carboxypeptidase family protein